MIAEASVSRKDRVQMLRELAEDVIYTNITKASLKKVWIISEIPNSLRLKSIVSYPYWMKQFNFSTELRRRTNTNTVSHSGG